MRRARELRHGVAAVELAILLPFLAFLFVIAVDWSRVFYYGVVIDNCARNGALYTSDPYSSVGSPYASATAAALADAPAVTPTPTVTTASGSDASGPYVECTVNYTFTTLTNFPGVPHTTTISRKVRAYQAPQLPK